MATKTYKPKRKISATESEEIKIPASSVDGLSTVATSGSYNDLSNKPAIPSVPTNYVTTDTAQEITGNKTVSSPQTILDTNLIIRHDVSNGKNIAISSVDQSVDILQIENNQVYYDPDGNGFPLNFQGVNPGTDGQVLTSRGANNSPEWANVPKTEVVQATGTSTTSVMSQKATTDELAKKANLNGENIFTGNQTIQDSQLSVIRDSSQGSGYIFDTYDNNSGANAGTILGVYQTGKDAGRVIIGEYSTVELTLGGNSGTSSQVLTSQGAGKTPIWTTPAKGTVTQVKINGTTKSPNNAGLVDLGTVGGGVQVLTATEVDMYLLSDGVYLWKFMSGYSSYTFYTLSGIGNTSSPKKFTFRPDSYSRLAVLEVNRPTTNYINFTLSQNIPSSVIGGGGKTITYMDGAGKIEEYSNWRISADVGGTLGGGITIIDSSIESANLKATIMPDTEENNETTNVTVSIAGANTTTIKTITKSSINFPMSLVFERTTAGGLLISETALDGAFDSFGNGDDGELYNDDIDIDIQYTTDRSSVYTYFTLNGITITPITYS